MNLTSAHVLILSFRKVFMNRTRLALMTEWNFAQGKLKSYDDLIQWSIYLAFMLQQKSNSPLGPADLGVRNAVQRGAAEILRDLHPIWRKLSYGGRGPENICPERVKFLETTMAA